MQSYYLYVHITPSNKYYIGITKSKPENRWKNGYGYVSSPHFYNAILKYGWSNIKHIILLENLSKEVACECEKFLIDKYNTTNPKFGYNVCVGGEGTHGYHHTESSKQKLREATLSSLNRGQREQISKTVKRRWKEGAYANRQQNQVAWNKGLTIDDNRVAKYARKVGEFHHSQESKIKMSISHKGKPAYNRKRVECIETGVVYSSVSEAQKITCINNISIAARDQHRTAGSLHWRYLNE